MCDLYASTDPALYESATRSVRIGGVVTSVRLETRFWQILDQLAAGEGRTTPQFLTTLYDEVSARREEVGNFSSLLRVVCTVYLTNQQQAQAAS